MEKVDNKVSGNVDDCKIQVRRIPEIRVQTNGGVKTEGTIQVYGLRGIQYSRIDYTDQSFRYMAGNSVHNENVDNLNSLFGMVLQSHDKE